MAVDPLALDLAGNTASLGEVLERQVGVLREAHRQRQTAAAKVLRGTGCMEGTDEELLGRTLTISVAREATARDRGFTDWDVAMTHRDEPVDLCFEGAADAIQWGRLDTLRMLLDAYPALIEARSPFPHHAMLIHHVAANGIEVSRQLHSPPNAVAILRLLLERGADPDAPCDIYGHRNTTLCLLVSSAGPAAAGVEGPLVEELARGGADVNGLDDDGLPLWTAIIFGHTEAAEALARSGARVDNVVFAAALGDLALVDTYFGDDGALRPHGIRSAGRVGAALDPKLFVEYALIWAAGHGRTNVVEYLLDKHPDLTVAEPAFNATALDAARYHHRTDLVALLEQAAGR